MLFFAIGVASFIIVGLILVIVGLDSKNKKHQRVCDDATEKYSSIEAALKEAEERYAEARDRANNMEYAFHEADRERIDQERLVINLRQVISRIAGCGYTRLGAQEGHVDVSVPEPVWEALRALPVKQEQEKEQEA